MQSVDVAIVGGGMVGLAVACGLQGSGLRVAVLEQRVQEPLAANAPPQLRVSAIILGKFPLPVEVIPMARSAVARQLVKLGGRPEYRQGVVTDNGNVILDVHGMEILDPIAMENAINAIPGVVTVGLFANRGADVALIGTPDGVKTIVK